MAGWTALGNVLNSAHIHLWRIPAISTLDNRETDKKSVNLEKAGLIRGQKEIQEQDLHVTKVVTDAHLQIGAVMSM